MFTLSTSSTVVETMSTLLLHNFHFAPHNSLNYKISPLPRRLSFTNARLCIKNNQISCNSLRMDSSENISGTQEKSIPFLSQDSDFCYFLFHSQLLHSNRESRFRIATTRSSWVCFTKPGQKKLLSCAMDFDRARLAL